MSPGARPGPAVLQERQAMSQECCCSRGFGAVEGFFWCHNTKTQQNPMQRARGRAVVAPQGTQVPLSPAACWGWVRCFCFQVQWCGMTVEQLLWELLLSPAQIRG